MSPHSLKTCIRKSCDGLISCPGRPPSLCPKCPGTDFRVPSSVPWIMMNEWMVPLSSFICQGSVLCCVHPVSVLNHYFLYNYCIPIIGHHIKPPPPQWDDLQLEACWTKPCPVLPRYLASFCSSDFVLCRCWAQELMWHMEVTLQLKGSLVSGTTPVSWAPLSSVSAS